MSTKDVVAIAANVAQVVIALLAVWPLVYRGVYLIRTMPPMSVDEQVDRIALSYGYRMGWFQRWWTRFLRWARKDSRELLTWKEQRYRYLWCPAGGHHGRRRQLRDGGVELVCRDCHAIGSFDTKEEVESWAESGKEAPGLMTTPRVRIDPTAERITEVARKLAEALNNNVSWTR